jgi:hypothetical protein
MQQKGATKNARPCGLAISMPKIGRVTGETSKEVSGGATYSALLLVATLVTSLTKQLAVLLLRHALATLLDYGTHTHLLNSGFTDS